MPGQWPLVLDGGYNDEVELLGLPGGNLLVVSIEASRRRAQLRVLHVDGSLLWSRVLEGSSFAAASGAPPVAVDRLGNVYVSIKWLEASEHVAIDGIEATCDLQPGWSTALCGLLASFASDGNVRWLEPIPGFAQESMTAVEDGVVIAGWFTSEPTLVAVSSSGQTLWQRSWPSGWEYASLFAPHNLASDGAGGFYLGGSKAMRAPGRMGCGALARHSALDGSLTWERLLCGTDDDPIAELEDVVAFEDGSVVAAAFSKLLGFGLAGAPSFESSTPAGIPQLRAFDSRTAVILGEDADHHVGFLSAIDATGEARWRLPAEDAVVDAGALDTDGGESADDASALCDGDVAAGPVGIMYVLTGTCPRARRLLATPNVAAGWSGAVDEIPYDARIVAPLRIPSTR